MSDVNPVFFLLALFSQLIASSSQMLLKKSAQKKYPNVIREYLNVLVISGYGMIVIAMVIAIVCYRGLGYLGTVVMEPIGYIIVMIMSRVFFKEKFTPTKVVGGLMIVAGIAVYYMF